MPDLLKVRLVTPDRILVDQTVEAVEVPGKSGYFEVLYGHAPLLSEIGAGEVRLHGGEAGEQRLCGRSRLRRSAARARHHSRRERQKPEEIDTGAVQEQLQHGEKLWNEAGEDPEKYAHANEVIAEAEAKQASTGAGKH